MEPTWWLAGFLLVVVLVMFGLPALLRRSERKRQARREANREAHWARLDAEQAEAQAALEIERAKQRAEMERQHRRLQLEIQRRMPRRAQSLRRRLPNRRPWPIVAGMAERNRQEDQLWRTRRQSPAPKQILNLGRFQLWKH